MKKQMAITSLAIGCVIFSVFIFTGINVISRYSYNKTDWHFKAALVGTILFCFLLISSIAALFITPKQKSSLL